MFENLIFEKYGFKEIPLQSDILVSDEKWMSEYESMYMYALSGGLEYYDQHSFSAMVSESSDQSLSIRIQINHFDRNHAIDVQIHHQDITQIVGCSKFNGKPTIFVRSNWLNRFESRKHSIYALVDGAGMKKALQLGGIDSHKFTAFRAKIDESSNRHDKIGYISFADSVILKQDWRICEYARYSPEEMIAVVGDIRNAFRDCFSISAYAVFTQGINEYQDPGIFHFSDSKNHICMNSFGTPFAQLTEIEKSARDMVHNKPHEGCDFYFSETAFRSLEFMIVSPKTCIRHFEYFSSISKQIERYVGFNWDDLSADEFSNR